MICCLLSLYLVLLRSPITDFIIELQHVIFYSECYIGLGNRPSAAVADFQLRLSACVDDTAACRPMLANRLQLNTGKTDVTVLTCSGARLLVVVISCPLHLSGSGLTSSSRRPQSETSESTSTLTSACDATFRKQLPTALPSYASCAV